jgi:transcriptional regulator of acetoin/glycerol metabolism
MAESKRGSGKRSSGGSSSTAKGRSSSSQKKGSSGSRSSSSNRRSAQEVVGDAVEQIQQLIGRRVEAVTGMEKDGSDWTVTVEVVEVARIPNTTDVLGKYEVIVDRNGEITSARRTRRYHRAEAGED